MNSGISFEEACEITPDALTAEQLQQCGSSEAVAPGVVLAVAVAVVLLGLAVFLLVRVRR